MKGKNKKMESLFDLLSSVNSLIIKIETIGISVLQYLNIVSTEKSDDGLTLYTDNEGVIFLHKDDCELCEYDEKRCVVKTYSGVVITLIVLD